ncbi:MAG TPA: argininosuccinate lyase, partial [Vicinamibacterales bacterium]
MTLWSGRFDTAPDPAAFDFGISFGFDRALFEDDVTGSIAWADALSAAGVLSAEDTAAIVAALRDILEQGRKNPAWISGSDEDVHSFVERQLVERIGDAGRRLHTGRSRNEQVSLDLRLYLRRRIPLLQQAIARLVMTCADQAERSDAALMPSYTHLRRAQPVLVAHFFLSHASALRRDYDRLQAAADEADALPLGSGAIAGTSYAIDTHALARALGFSRVVLNSIDASSDRDFAASFLYSAALTMVHLSRMAEDLIIFTGEEHAFFGLADASATGSSMMPQKKNPDPLELVRGKAGRVIGRLSGWLATMKGLPIGYSKDLQEDKEALFEAEDTLRASLTATASVVGGLAINRDTTARAASGLLLATDVADYLVAKGVPFRDAHEIVGALVRRLVREGRSFDTLTVD